MERPRLITVQVTAEEFDELRFLVNRRINDRPKPAIDELKILMEVLDSLDTASEARWQAVLEYSQDKLAKARATAEKALQAVDRMTKAMGRAVDAAHDEKQD